MKEIIKVLTMGSTIEKISLISNLATILGISVATLVAGPFLQSFAGREFKVYDFVLSVIFYTVYIACSGKIIIPLLSEALSSFTNKDYSATFAKSLIAAVTLSFSFLLFPSVKYYTGKILALEYLLPQPAEVAISGIEILDHTETKENLAIKGLIKTITLESPDNYEILLYNKDEQGIFSPIKFANSEYSIVPNKKGSFTLPINTRWGPAIKEPHLVIYRKADWSFWRKVSGEHSGFPHSATQLPDTEVEGNRAFIYAL